MDFPLNPVRPSENVEKSGQEGSEPPDGGTDMQVLLGNIGGKFLEPTDHPDGESLSAAVPILSAREPQLVEGLKVIVPKDAKRKIAQMRKAWHIYLQNSQKINTSAFNVQTCSEQWFMFTSPVSSAV